MPEADPIPASQMALVTSHADAQQGGYSTEENRVYDPEGRLRIRALQIIATLK